MENYFYPEYKLVIGGAVITEGVRLEFYTDKEISFDWLDATFTRKLLDVTAVAPDTEVKLSLGYNGSMADVFSGYVTGANDLKITAKNEMLKLHKTRIINTFRSCTPQDVLTFILGEAGIEEFALSEENYPVKKLYIVSNLTAMQALKDVNRFFGIENVYCLFNCKKFEWNATVVQGANQLLQYGVNIIELICISESVWELETILIPSLRVYQNIDVEHPKLSGTFRIDSLRYIINESGFIRLKIRFREE